MKLLLTIATYLGSLVAVALVAFFMVIFLAGPHAGLLPHALEAVVLILGWLSVLVLPVWAAWVVWHRAGSPVPSNPQSIGTRTKAGRAFIVNVSLEFSESVMNTWERVFVGTFGLLLLGVGIYALMLSDASPTWRYLGAGVFGVLGLNAIYGCITGNRPWVSKIGPLP